MKSSEEGRWTAFGVAVWILGITVLIAGFVLSQQRETKITQQCGQYVGGNCHRWIDVEQTIVTPLAIVGYVLAALGILFIISGFIVFFVLTSRSKSRVAKANTVAESESPEDRELKR